MMNLEKAKALLLKDRYTCVLCKDDEILTSHDRGVAPLIRLLGQDLRGFSAADKVVGRATALLYCLHRVQAVYAQIISTEAIEVLQAHGISVSWARQVPYIQNRAGDGRCPMELATQGIADPEIGLAAIRRKLEELQR